MRRCSHCGAPADGTRTRGPDVLCGECFATVPAADLDAGPVTFEAEMTLTLDTEVSEETMRILFGAPPEPTYSLVWEGVYEPLVPPRKGRRLTGKAYRAARRRYRRERRQWLRDGAPMVRLTHHVPHARAVTADDGSVTFAVLPEENPEWLTTP